MALLVGGGVFIVAHVRSVVRDLSTPRDLHDAEHTTSGECARCHPAQLESWANTFHSTITQEASPSSVLGDFEDATYRYGGVEARMERTAGGGYRMRFLGPGGREWTRVDVVRTIGSHRYQQYLGLDEDLYFRLPVAWNIEEERWLHMNGAFLTPDPERDGPAISPEGYYRHVTRWNDNCIFCHTVGPNPGRDGESFDTAVEELGIACWACHGPADEHARINADPLRRYALHLSGEPDPTIVNPNRLTPDRAADICGRCHGQRVASNVASYMEGGDPFVPGEVLSDYTRPLSRETSFNGEPNAFALRFWPDGTPRLAAYEYQGLHQSACDDLTCISCHSSHEGDPRGLMRPDAEGDQVCAERHEELVAEPSAHSRSDDLAKEPIVLFLYELSLELLDGRTSEDTRPMRVRG